MGFKKTNRATARKKKHFSVRKKVIGTPERPRLCVFKSAKNIYAQLIDDLNQKTLFGVSTLSPGLRDDVSNAKSKVEKATIIGKAIAEKAAAENIEQIVFDRSGYIYHGRIKALADGAREGGLKF